MLISVQAVGINPSDTYIRSGTYKLLPTLPYTPGKDGAGIVEEVGSEIRTIRVNRHIICYHCNRLATEYLPRDQ